MGMAINNRLGTVFVSGFLLGAAALAGAWKKVGQTSPVESDKLKAKALPPQPMPETARTSVPPTHHFHDTPRERAEQQRARPVYRPIDPPQQSSPDAATTRVFPSQLEQARQRVSATPGTSDSLPQPAVDRPNPGIRQPRSTPAPAEAGVPPFRPLPDHARTRIPPEPSGFEEHTAGTAVRNPIPSPRKLALYASGFVIGAAVVVGTWLALDSSLLSTPSKFKTGILASQSGPSALKQSAACPVQPTTAAANEKDGRFPLQADVSGLIAADMASFIIVGKEAAAAGRPRDAEVAFLMSCRVAEKLKGIDSIESADAKYQLGEHYASLALVQNPAAGANRPELLNRAERLYADSSRAYLAKYGQANEKTRLAADGLAAVRQTLAQVNTGQFDLSPPNAVPPALVQQEIAKPQQPQPVAGSGESVRSSAGQAALRMPEPAAMYTPPVSAGVAKVVPALPKRTATRAGPSFDCSYARSWAERAICSDAELARLDRELGRVYAQARNSSTDRAAFRRQQDQELRRREATCRDRECLLRWYAQRRYQLINDIEGRRRSQLAFPGWGTPQREVDRFYRGN